MKDTNLAYLLWFFFGLHYAYLGKWFTQLLYIVTIGGLGVWAIVDLFRIPSMVSKYNKKHLGE